MLDFNNLRKLTGGLFALSLLAASVPARAADYAPIDCSKASARTGGSPNGDIVRRGDVAGRDGAACDIGDAQRKWLKERNACGDDGTCLARASRAVLRSRRDRIARSVLNTPGFDSSRCHRPSL
jgi:uncharacterized protein